MAALSFRNNSVRKLAVFGVLNFIATVILLLWSNSCNSMALTAFAYLTIFDMFSLATCFVSLWVRSQKPSRTYSFGYQRFEVLAVFSSTILAQLGSLFILKESVERLIQQPDVHESRLLPGTALAFVMHMLINYSVENTALNHVVLASSSSWLQEHVSDLSESLCGLLPGMSKLLLPRLNPFALIGSASACSIVITYFLIDLRNFHSADTWAAIWIAVMTVGTLSPMSAYTGKILLQTTPSHIISQLDKCIREAQTLDGVLEFRQEHFWTLSFGTMCGSVHVRIRRDADEQMVLAHVFNRLSNLVTILTVHIFKDDWNRPTSYQLLGDNTGFKGRGAAVSIAMGNSLVSASPALTSSHGAAYTTPYMTKQHVPHMAAGAQMTNSYSGQVQMTKAYSNAAAAPVGLAQQNGGTKSATTGVNINNLNPDIMNLLGSTGQQRTGNAQVDMRSMAGHSFPVPNKMADLSHNHMTYPAPRTEPDGASKSH